MNDPFECLWTIDRTFSKAALEEFRIFANSAKSKTLRDLSVLESEKLIGYINQIRKERVKKFAFCSLSENPLDILMWSHYADSHKGIAIGFEFDDFSNGRVFQKVEYLDGLAEFDLLEWAKYVDGNDELLIRFLKDITVKSLDWQREKEWRIWRNAPCYYGYKSHEIKEINFGINCDDETKSIVARIVELHDDVKLFDLETRENPFRLVR